MRKLVGMLARRTELWRDARGDWTQASRESLYRGDIAEAPLQHSATALGEFAQRLDSTALRDLQQGKIA